MAATAQVQGQGQQPVVVHVHVHMHNDEKQDKQPPPMYEQQIPYETPQRGPPVFYESPQRSFQYARTLGLPQPRPMYPQNQLPRLVYSRSAPDPAPVLTSQTPRLVQQYSPGNSVSSTEENGGDTKVRYVYREARVVPVARPIESVIPPASMGYQYNFANGNSDRHLSRNEMNRQIIQRGTENNTHESQSDNKSTYRQQYTNAVQHSNESNRSTNQSGQDIGLIFRPGYSEKYVRNMKRETLVKPGVRLPNTVSVNTQETSTNQQDEVDRTVYNRTVYRPLKEVFTDKRDAPVSFELKQPRFPYTYPKSGGLSGSRSMTSLDGKTHDKHVVFENAKHRPVFKDENTGKTFRIHSMLPIQEERKLDNAVLRRYRFYDHTYKPVYSDNPAAPKSKRNSMPAEMASFRLDNSSPAFNLTRETEEADQLQSILKNAR